MTPGVAIAQAQVKELQSEIAILRSNMHLLDQQNRRLRTRCAELEQAVHGAEVAARDLLSALEAGAHDRRKATT